jgi:hypothetical protein
MKTSKFATMAQSQKQPPTDPSKKATYSSNLKSKPTTRSVLKGQNQTKNVEELRKNEGKPVAAADQNILQGTNHSTLEAEDKLATQEAVQSKESTDKTHKHQHGNDDAMTTKNEDEEDDDKHKDTAQQAKDDESDDSVTGPVAEANTIAASSDDDDEADEADEADEDEDEDEDEVAADDDADDEEDAAEEDSDDAEPASKLLPPKTTQADSANKSPEHKTAAELEYKEYNLSDEVDEYVTLIDLQGKGFKNQTDSWKNAKAGIMKHIEQFTATDHDCIQNIMQDISKVLGQAVEDFTQAYWTKTLVSTQDIVSNRNKHRIIRIFCLSLANSNPASLFDKPLFDGSKLLDSSITCAWAAAYSLYGSGWRPKKGLIDVGTSIAPTKLFSSRNKNTVLTAQPFASGDVFTEDPQSLHNLEGSMKKWLKMKATGEVLDPGAWAQSMTTKFSNPKIQHACLRLAKTPVSIFADLNFLSGNDLDKILITSIWMGAHLTLGDRNPPALGQSDRHLVNYR